MEIKVSTYDFFNKFILGLVFIGVVVFSYWNEVYQLLETYSVIKWNSVIITFFYVSTLAIVYEMGILINRLGSILEDLLRSCHLIPFNKDYKKFNDKKKEYPILNILSREYALSRNSVVLFLLISIVVFISFAWYGLIPIVIMFVFYYSSRKYSQKIVDLMK